MGQGDGDFPIAAAGDFNIQLEVAVIQNDVKLLILLGRGGRVFRSLRSCRGYRSHRTSAAGCGASALITTGCGAAFTAGRAAFAAGRAAGLSTGRAAGLSAGRAAFTAGRAAFAAGRAAFAAGRAAFTAGRAAFAAGRAAFTRLNQFNARRSVGRAAFARLNQFNARRSAGRAAFATGRAAFTAGRAALIGRLHRQRNFLLSPLVARCFRILRDGNVVPAFLHDHLHSGPAVCVKRRRLFRRVIVIFGSKQLHHNAFARRAGQRDGNHTVTGRELHSDFFAAHRLLRLVFLQRRDLRLARRSLGLRQRKRRGRRKEHAYAQHHRNFAFHFISIHPDSLHDEKSLRVSAPSYHVSSLYATDRAAMRPLHTERTSAAISSHLAEIFY